MGKIVGDTGEFCFKEALDIGGEGSTSLVNWRKVA